MNLFDSNTTKSSNNSDCGLLLLKRNGIFNLIKYYLYHYLTSNVCKQYINAAKLISSSLDTTITAGTSSDSNIANTISARVKLKLSERLELIAIQLCFDLKYIKKLLSYLTTDTNSQDILMLNETIN